MIVNQANLRGLDVSYSTAYNKAFSGAQTTYKQIAEVVQSTTAQTDYKWLGQIPRLREWIGDREVQNLSSYGYSIRNKKFEMTIGVSRDDIEDDQYGVYAPLMAHMGEAAAMHPEILVYKTLKAGFKEKCYDGKPFFSDSHVYSSSKNAEKYSNLTKYKLDMEAYQEARSAMMGLVGDNGDPLNIVPDLLVVSPANEKTARLILEADLIGGTSNVYKGTAKLLVSTQLADKPDAWYLLCTSRFLKPLIFQERSKIKLTSRIKDTDENVWARGVYEWGADGRSNAGYGFWQMAYAGEGTQDRAG